MQFGEKNVEEFAAAVMAPCLEVVTVTEELVRAVTTPVKSSMKSSWPVERLLAEGGSAAALKTLAAPRFTAVTT